MPTVIGAGETPGLFPNPEVKPRSVLRCTGFREGPGSAETVGLGLYVLVHDRMRIFVRVKPNAKRSEVEKIGEEFLVSVKAPPVKGRANAELIEVLADYFKVPKSKVKIVAGERSKRKVVEIE